MSYYESEIGSWNFPAGGWMKSVKALYEANCEMHNAHWDVAERFYIEAKAEKLRDYRKDFWDILNRAKGSVFGWQSWYGRASEPRTPDWFDSDIVMKFVGLNTRVHKDDRAKPKKPKKMDRKTPLKRGFPDEASFGGEWPELTVNIKSRSVRLEIQNGNHAVQRWWSTPVGIKFTEILQNTKWTGDNGGYSIHRGECDNERDYEPAYDNVYGGKKFMKEFRKRRGW